MGGSEQARRPLLVDDEEDPLRCSSTLNIGVNGSSTATRFLVFSTIVAATCSFNAGYSLGYSSPAEYGVLADLSLSMAEYSVFGSMLAVGGMIGALINGKIADFFGRRTIWESKFRCLQGNVFIAEIAPKNIRGGLMTTNALMTSSGVAIVYLIGSVVKWRGLALIGCIPCLLQTLCIFFIPESPRWLVKNGLEQEFEDVLQHLRGKKVDISQEAVEIKEYAAYIQLLSENKILDLFQKKYAGPIIVAAGLMILTQFSGLTGYTFYLTNIFALADISTKVGYAALAIIKVSAAGTCLGSLLTGLSFLFQDLHPWISVFALTGVSVYIVSFNLGIAGIPWIITSEIFPINVKGSAGSLCNLIYWFCSWVVSYTFNFLLEWSSTGDASLLPISLSLASLCVSAFGFLFIVTLVPETKGRSLEEIQASITNVLH
ncbi:unnamed protein product [Dovyalis caffra]|uniref:Sugar transporter n=1 Tax=Dovyalis caffra TaxID=77055 RepID=A0AAV1RWV8_9ROSI|nr:unnamed protein product [Dovyalis caffra]